MTVKTALHQGSILLEEGKVLAPRLTAEVLLSHALQKERIYLFTHPEAELGQIAWLHYGRYLFERIKGRPTQYITRRQEFYGRDFTVSPQVLIPRPETELLVEAALPLEGRIVDVGTGSGAIAITLSLEKRQPILATDISAPALEIAAKNARTLGANVDFLQADLLNAIASRSVDAVVSNPPYISDKDLAEMQREVRDHEPHLALFAGPTGAEIYHRLIAGAARVLKPGGHLLLELGYDSLSAVRTMLDGSWTEITVTNDLAGIPRVLRARYHPGCGYDRSKPVLELWIGLVELKPVDRKAYGGAGAFTNIVTWASDIEEFRRKAVIVAATMDMYVADVEGPEPVAQRARKWTSTEEIEDMVLRAESNPNAIIYGTLHRYPFDEA